MAITKEGVYKAHVTNFAEGESSKGTLQMELTFTVLEGEFKNQTIRHWVYFATPKNSEISLELLRTCGWDGQYDGKWTGLGTKVVEIVCEFETYKEKTSLRVKYVNDPDNPRGGSKQLSAEGKSAFMKTLQGLAGHAPTVSSPPKEVDADNIPF